MRSEQLIFHSTGRWTSNQIHIERVRSTRRVLPEVESAIERAWTETLARPNVHLFDGPMCRLESWNFQPDRVELALSDTSYKPFLGTNLAHPEFAERFGRDVLANPVGVSPALVTRDGYIMMGRRNGSVAYYPNRIHPFAGALEPRDADDVFAAVRRELAEELSLTTDDLGEIVCTGLAEDVGLRQPELIFAATTHRMRAQVEEKLDATEHHDSWSIRADADSVAHAVGDEPLLTPVGRAAILLWGRNAFGASWFDRAG